MNINKTPECLSHFFVSSFCSDSVFSHPCILLLLFGLHWLSLPKPRKHQFSISQFSISSSTSKLPLQPAGGRKIEEGQKHLFFLSFGIWSGRGRVAKGMTEGQNIQEAHETRDCMKRWRKGEEIKRSYTKQVFQGQNEDDGSNKDVVDTRSKRLWNKPECEWAALGILIKQQLASFAMNSMGL